MLLGLLGENAARFGVALHAYVLMDNHFHLLATPSTADGLPQWMQAVGRRYVRYFNDRHGRTGTLWEGRYRSTLIQTDRYLLACMAYIDLNPVRAGMVAEARDYPWSSHAHYAGLRHDRLLTPHPLVLGARQHAVRPRSRVCRIGARRRIRRRSGGADRRHAARLGCWATAIFSNRYRKRQPRRVLKARPGRPPTARSDSQKPATPPMHCDRCYDF